MPIYDVGIDEKGRLYYTMPLIRGHDLRTIFDLVRAGDPDWYPDAGEPFQPLKQALFDGNAES